MSRSIRRRIEKELQKYQLFKYCTSFTQSLCKLSVGKACISNRYRTRVYSSKSKNCTTSPPPRHSIAGQYNRSLPSNWPNKSFRRESNKKGFWNQRRWEDKMKLKMRDIKDREEGKVSEGVAVVWGQLSLLSSFLGIKRIIILTIKLLAYFFPLLGEKTTNVSSSSLSFHLSSRLSIQLTKMTNCGKFDAGKRKEHVQI